MPVLSVHFTLKIILNRDERYFENRRQEENTQYVFDNYKYKYTVYFPTVKTWLEKVISPTPVSSMQKYLQQTTTTTTSFITRMTSHCEQSKENIAPANGTIARCFLATGKRPKGKQSLEAQGTHEQNGRSLHVRMTTPAWMVSTI